MMKIIKLIKPASIILIALLLIVNFTFFYYGQFLLKPVDDNDVTDKLVYIKSGMSLKEVSEKLYQDKLIKSDVVFRLYLQLKGLATGIQAGYYKFNTGMRADEIIDKLIKGNTASYRLTIPEGSTIEDIADRLVSKGLDKEKFLKLARNKKSEFIEGSNNVNYKLEGFLFPDTYSIPYEASEEQVIVIMFREFKKKISLLNNEIEESRYDLYQIITIASLIQAETSYIDEEAALISGVIYNRLNRKMKLQLDATVQYSLPEHKVRLLYSDLKVESPYNTYLNRGLPPGPINNPGLAAIKAALNPADVDYLYYVATKSGRHKFTRTYQEHLEVQSD